MQGTLGVVAQVKNGTLVPTPPPVTASVFFADDPLGWQGMRCGTLTFTRWRYDGKTARYYP